MIHNFWYTYIRETKPNHSVSESNIFHFLGEILATAYNISHHRQIIIIIIIIFFFLLL